MKKDLVDPITPHKGLTVCKYKESNLGPVTGFRALIIIAKRLVRSLLAEALFLVFADGRKETSAMGRKWRY